MSSLMIFQVTALMIFLYSLKIKMYKNNMVGFITISTIFVSIIFAYFDFAKYEDMHYLLISLLLIFIAIYHTYKVWKRSCKTNSMDVFEGFEC